MEVRTPSPGVACCSSEAIGLVGSLTEGGMGHTHSIYEPAAPSGATHWQPVSEQEWKKFVMASVGSGVVP